MPETPLGPAETAHEIAGHLGHGHGELTAGHDRRLSMVEAGLLAFVALLAAWSGFAAAKWTTESRVELAEASTIRNEGNTVEITGLSLRVRDSVQFNAWFAARAAGNPEVEALAIRRFRPAFRTAFDAWLATDPDNNPDAPAGPQDMPQYHQPGLAESHRIREEGEARFQEGTEDGETADEYIKVTVYLASVLFLVGISTQFRVKRARYALLIVSGVILVFAISQLVTLEAPPL